MAPTVRTGGGTRNPGAVSISGEDNPTPPVPERLSDTDGMGFNPFRAQRRSSADYVMVVATLVVCALLVAWAIFG